VGSAQWVSLVGGGEEFFQIKFIFHFFFQITANKNAILIIFQAFSSKDPKQKLLKIYALQLCQKKQSQIPIRF
jgi:hypothetical protein